MCMETPTSPFGSEEAGTGSSYFHLPSQELHRRVDIASLAIDSVKDRPQDSEFLMCTKQNGTPCGQNVLCNFCPVLCYACWMGHTISCENIGSALSRTGISVEYISPAELRCGDAADKEYYREWMNLPLNWKLETDYERFVAEMLQKRSENRFRHCRNHHVEALELLMSFAASSNPIVFRGEERRFVADIGVHCCMFRHQMNNEESRVTQVKHSDLLQGRLDAAGEHVLLPGGDRIPLKEYDEMKEVFEKEIVKMQRLTFHEVAINPFGHASEQMVLERLGIPPYLAPEEMTDEQLVIARRVPLIREMLSLEHREMMRRAEFTAFNTEQKQRLDQMDQNIRDAIEHSRRQREKQEAFQDKLKKKPEGRPYQHQMSSTMSGGSPQHTGIAISDVAVHGVRITTVALPNVSKVPHAGHRMQPTNIIDNKWDFMALSDRYVDTGSFVVNAADLPGKNVLSMNLPHDILTQNSIKVPLATFIMMRPTVTIRLTVPTLLSQQGILRAFFVPHTQLDSSVFGMVNASYHQGAHIFLQSGKAFDIECTYNSYCSFMNTNFVPATPDEDVTIGQFNVLVMAPFVGTTEGITISVKAKFAFTDFKIPRQIVTLTRRRFKEDNKFFPFPPRADLKGEMLEKYRAVYAQQQADEDQEMSVRDERFSIQDVSTRDDVLVRAAEASGGQYVPKPVIKGQRTGPYQLQFDAIGRIVSGIFGGGGGGTSITNNNNYDAHTTYDIGGNVSGGLRSNTGRGGDVLDQKDQLSDKHDTAISGSLDLSIPTGDKPRYPVPGHPIWRVPMQNMSNVSGTPYVAHHLDYEAYSEHKMSMLNLGILTDEMDIMAMIRRPSYSGFHFQITDTTVAGSHLLTMPITPCPLTWTNDAYVADDIVEVSFLEYFYRMFAGWKGELEYTLYLSKNNYGRGRMCIVTDFQVMPDAGVPPTQAQSVMNQYFTDLEYSDVLNNYIMSIPFMNNLDALNVSARVPFGSSAADTAVAQHRASPGCFRFYALTPLTSTGAPAPQMDVNIYIAAGCDMVWAHPAYDTMWQPYLARTVPPTEEETDEWIKDIPEGRVYQLQMLAIGNGDQEAYSVEEPDDQVAVPSGGSTILPGGGGKTGMMSDMINKMGLGPARADKSNKQSAIGGGFTASTGKNQVNFGNYGSSKGASVQANVPPPRINDYSFTNSLDVSRTTGDGRIIENTIQFAGPGDGPVGYTTKNLSAMGTGDMSISADQLLSNGGIDQAIAPNEVVNFPADPITSIYIPGPRVDMSSKFHVTPALRSLKHYTKRMNKLCTVALAQVSVKPFAAVAQTVSFIALPVCTGMPAVGWSQADRIACMYNYGAGDFCYQFQVNYDRTDPMAQGLVFKATLVPSNPVGTNVGGTGVTLEHQVDSLGAVFLKHDPATFVAEDQPCAYMTDDCHVLDVSLPYNNQTSYVRPSQLKVQDAIAGTGIMRPLLCRNIAGVNEYMLQALTPAMSRYMSGILLFGIDNGSVLDTTKIPQVNVIVRFCVGDNFRYSRFLQVPRLRLSNLSNVPLVGPLTSVAARKGRVIDHASKAVK